MIALFDHEEVGSGSISGASGPFLAAVIERLHEAGGGSRDDLHRALAGSSCVSADNAHAVHPNYPERHDPDHAPLVNHGPAIKLNANQRYATSADTAALFGAACDQAGVPHQTFVSRNNVPCGSTIGPLTATRLGHRNRRRRRPAAVDALGAGGVRSRRPAAPRPSPAGLLQPDPLLSVVEQLLQGGVELGRHLVDARGAAPDRRPSRAG